MSATAKPGAYSQEEASLWGCHFGQRTSPKAHDEESGVVSEVPLPLEKQQHTIRPVPRKQLLATVLGGLIALAAHGGKDSSAGGGRSIT